MGFDVADRLIERVVRHHRDDRGENLVLQDLHLWRHVGQHRRVDGQVLGLERAADGNRGSLLDRVVEHRLDAVEIRLVDDLRYAVLVELAGIVIEVLRDVGAEALNQRGLLVFLDEDVVRADAGLSTVELLGCGKLRRDLGNIRTVVDDDRRLAPSSSVTLVRCLAAAAITIFPTRGLPVKKM